MATLLLIAFTLFTAGVPLRDWPEIIRSQHISWKWIAAAAAAMFSTVIVNSWKWHITLRLQGLEAKAGRVFYHYSAGYFFNSFITGTGDIKRAMDMGRELGSPPAVWASVIADRWSGAAGQMLLALFTLILALGRVPQLGTVCWSAAAAVALMFGGFYVFASIPLFKERPSDSRIKLALWRMQKAFAVYKQHSAALLACVVIGLAAPMLLVVVHIFLARALHIDTPASALWLYIPTVSVFAQLPVTINGFGLQDYCMLHLLGSQMLPQQAITLSAAFHGARLGMGAAGGLVYAFLPGLGMTAADSDNTPEAVNGGPVEDGKT